MCGAEGESDLIRGARGTNLMAMEEIRRLLGLKKGFHQAYFLSKLKSGPGNHQVVLVDLVAYTIHNTHQGYAYRAYASPADQSILLCSSKLLSMHRVQFPFHYVHKQGHVQAAFAIVKDEHDQI